MMKNHKALFLSHGSPLLALDTGKTHQLWRQLAKKLPIKLIIGISAHNPSLTVDLDINMDNPLLYDFGGFPQELYEIEYPTKGGKNIEKELEEMIEGFKKHTEIRLTTNRGLDHGLWVPLKHMYPTEDIIVLPMSYIYNDAPSSHLAYQNFALGQTLAKFAPKDSLIMGSGSMTHNLKEVFRSPPKDTHYVQEFTNWWKDKVEKNDIDSLLNYRALAPYAERAHPTEDHILPFFVALGAAEHLVVSHSGNYVTDKVLAMDCYLFE